MGERLDVTVREATLDDVTGMSRVFVDTYRTAHRGQVPEAELLERTYESSARGWERALREITTSRLQTTRPHTRAETGFEGERIWVAVDGVGDIVGVTMGGPPKPWPADDAARSRTPTGECYALYVDVPRQGVGVGRALLSEVAAFLVAGGVHRLLVGVLAVNHPARGFYERVGGVLLGEREIGESGDPQAEVVYVWNDLTRFAT